MTSSASSLGFEAQERAGSAFIEPHPSGPKMNRLVIAVDDPRGEDIRALLNRHLSFSRRITPLRFAYVLDGDELCDPSVTFFSARRAGALLAVGALRRLGETHAELKSMHTIQEARGQGIGRAMVNHLLTTAADWGCMKVSLETGSMPGFEPARSLYASVGFVPCQPFGEYAPNPYSVFMTITL